MYTPFTVQDLVNRKMKLIYVSHTVNHPLKVNLMNNSILNGGNTYNTQIINMTLNAKLGRTFN
jgi:hypothetical protein